MRLAEGGPSGSPCLGRGSDERGRASGDRQKTATPNACGLLARRPR